jgi:hypothetical protein
MAEFTIEDLYKKYQEQRQSRLNFDQFLTFVIFFPTLLVITSDGVVDVEEWDFVKQLSKFLANTYKDEGLSPAEIDQLNISYLEETSYLLKNLKDWESKFINALKTYLVNHPETRETILDTIYLFAEASSGTSAHEEAKIRFLKEELSLES